jgi:Uma2 family endonuclease
MTTAPTRSFNLEAFLQLPETEPASEFIDGQILQKPMPKGKHSRLQLRICNSVNHVTEPSKIAYAFPELRCTFGGRSLVPDIAVFEWSRIPFEPGGEVPNDFFICPDWLIEILSPEQSSNQVTRKILYSLQYGCRLGWLIDPSDRSVVIFQPKQELIVCEGQERLPVLPTIPLELTNDELFSWLKMG